MSGARDPHLSDLPDWMADAIRLDPDVWDVWNTDSHNARILKNHRSERIDEAGGIVLVRTGVKAYVMANRHLLSPATLRERRYVLEQFARFLPEDMPCRSVKAAHVGDWLAEMDVSASTIRMRLATVRAFYRWLLLRGTVTRDPTFGMKPPRQPKALPRCLSVDDVAALYAVLPDRRAEVIVSLMLHEGLRRSEVANLEMADLDLNSDTMRVLGKGNKEADLPITPPTRTALNLYFGERGRAAGPVIRSYTRGGGLSPIRIGALVREWMRDAGIKAAAFDGRSPHALRHTMSEQLYRRGVDLRVISDAMRHTNTQTTWIYLRHVRSLETLREVMGQTGPITPPPPRVGRV